MRYIMKLETGYLYHITHDFFSEMADMGLMFNKENQKYRPHFCAIQDSKNSELYWMIPLSSKIEKYQLIIQNKINKYGKCNTILIEELAGKKMTFLIQNAFPVTKKYISHIHTINNIPVKLTNELCNILTNNLNNVLSLKNDGLNLFYTNIDAIYSKLINQKELINDKIPIVEKNR